MEGMRSWEGGGGVEEAEEQEASAEAAAPRHPEGVQLDLCFECVGMSGEK